MHPGSASKIYRNAAHSCCCCAFKLLCSLHALASGQHPTAHTMHPAVCVGGFCAGAASGARNEPRDGKAFLRIVFRPPSRQVVPIKRSKLWSFVPPCCLALASTSLHRCRSDCRWVLHAGQASPTTATTLFRNFLGKPLPPEVARIDQAVSCKLLLVL